MYCVCVICVLKSLFMKENVKKHTGRFITVFGLFLFLNNTPEVLRAGCGCLGPCPGRPAVCAWPPRPRGSWPPPGTSHRGQCSCLQSKHSPARGQRKQPRVNISSCGTGLRNVWRVPCGLWERTSGLRSSQEPLLSLAQPPSVWMGKPRPGGGRDLSWVTV